MAEQVSGPNALVDRRIESLIRASAGRVGGIALRDMADLMPLDGPGSESALTDWLRQRDGAAIIRDGRVYGPNSAANVGPSETSSTRAELYLRSARSLFEGPLRAVGGLSVAVLVTGSTAFGAPTDDDDCDLFVIVRPGALWCVLGMSFLRFRLLPPATAGAPTSWCLNYVLDVESAREDFRAPRGFLFAREALTAIPLLGAEAYRALLGEASWLREEAPRLYDRWGPPGEAGHSGPPPPLAVRILNAILYVPMAGYLQAIGLLRNWRLRRSGRASLAFRTITSFRRFVIHSTKFDDLERIYRGTSAVPMSSGPE